MLDDLWPTYALRITTPRLVLRLPTDEEIGAIARVAADGVHHAGERPFLTPWTEGSAEERARSVLQGHWYRLASWDVDDWALGLGVFGGDGTGLDGRALGMITVRAKDFTVVREVVTSSWLGLAFQGRGLGTEARAGVLVLAFGHLGAAAARTEVFRDNAASQGVSRRLGYRPDGISRDARGDEVLLSDRLRLTADDWHPAGRAGEVSGLAGCGEMFTRTP